MDLDAKVAKWARKPIASGCGVVQPMVIGPTEIPRVATLEEALKSPEMAVLSVLAHFEEKDCKQLLRATVGALAHLTGPDQERAVAYYECMHQVIGPAFRAFMEELMQEEFNIAESAWARLWIGKGMEKGEAIGVARGKAEGSANTLIRQMSKRFGPVTPETSALIMSATIEQLDRGADAILDARSLTDVLDAVWATKPGGIREDSAQTLS